MALRNYATPVRLAVLESLDDLVRPDDIARMLDDLAPSDCYTRLLRLYQEKKFHRDWGEQSGLSLLLRTDQDRTWPIVEELMSGERDFYSFMAFRDIYPLVNMKRQQIIIDYYLNRPASLSSWELPRILEVAIAGAFSHDYRVSVLDRISEAAKVAFKRYTEREAFEKRLLLARKASRAVGPA